MRRTLILLSLSCFMALSSPARAAPSASEKAAAEALFQQASALIAKDQLAEACPKLEASQDLDPALGTMLRLADCYDRAGKSASAWALFQEAASLAASVNQSDREAIAAQRARELAARLSKIELKIHRDNWASTLSVSVNGITIPSASWDTPIPVDPGPQRIEASAPGRRSWWTTIEASKGPALSVVEVPKLAPAPRVLQQAPAVAWKDSPKAERGGTQRTLGYIAGGLGLAGLATSGALGYRAYDLNQQSLDQCRKSDANACSAQGKTIREDAQDFALGSTIALAAGGVLVATGVTLLLSAPSSEAPAITRRVRLRTATSRHGARFTFEARF